jgi:hypothetical protein
MVFKLLIHLGSTIPGVLQAAIRMHSYRHTFLLHRKPGEQAMVSEAYERVLLTTLQLGTFNCKPKTPKNEFILGDGAHCVF